MKERFPQHKGYINNNIHKQATGEHFNMPGHSIDNVKIRILKKVRKQDTSYRKERERYLIKKFNTYYKGINRMP